MITYTIAALLFKKEDEGLHTAVSAFDALGRLPASEREGVLSTAVVQRDPYGQAKFVQNRYWTRDESGQQGGLLGLIIGLIFAGPVVSLLGSLGVGAFLGDAFGRGLSHDFLTAVQNNTEPGDTLLLLLLNQPHEPFLTTHLPPPDQLHHTTLNIEINSGLYQALAGYIERGE